MHTKPEQMPISEVRQPEPLLRIRSKPFDCWEPYNDWEEPFKPPTLVIHSAVVSPVVMVEARREHLLVAELDTEQRS